MEKTQEYSDSRILTIPNALSTMRFCFIPLFIWLYCVKKDYARTTIILLTSGFTDILDGFIARRFHMISNLGKALDPIADKFTQGAMLLCLLTRFRFMWIPLILLILKEVFMGITGLIVIKKTGIVFGAEWHGKLTTCMVYATIMIHLVWSSIPFWLSTAFIISSITIMAYSCVAYGMRNYRLIQNTKAHERVS